jgi:hypothetical protein
MQVSTRLFNDFEPGQNMAVPSSRYAFRRFGCHTAAALLEGEP